MSKTRSSLVRASVTTTALLTSALMALSPLPAAALERADLIFVAGGTERLRERLIEGSLLMAADRDKVTDPQDILAAAQADYRRMVDLLYASGYYSGVVNIRIDGREAAEIPPLDPPDSISVAEIRIDPGPRFTFGLAEIGPLAPGRRPPEAFQPGAVARATAVTNTASDAIDNWRSAGHAKAEVSDQRVTAIHPEARLDAQIALSP